MKNIFLLLLAYLFIPVCYSQTITANDGNWTSKYETLSNTPEAELMVRTGDIDNLGFGWPGNFDPFSGNNTPAHAYPWSLDPLDPSGTDRIMVITSFTGASGIRDGYTNTTVRPDNSVRPISLSFTPPTVITKATLQIFVDDFQAPVWGSNYQVYLDSVRSSGLETIVNNLSQTGPIGKMITYAIHPSLLPQLQDGKLDLLFDDNTTGVGDGYAIDFVKLLINPLDTATTHTYLYGTVTDASTNNPVQGVVVSTSSSSVTATTDAAGFYLLPNVTPGIVQLSTFRTGYGQKNAIVSLQLGDSTQTNFQLLSPAPQLIYSSPHVNETNVDTQRVIKLLFDQPIDVSTFNASHFTLSDSVNNITGSFSTSNDTLIFTPTALASQKDYTLLIYHNLKSINGVSLAQDITIPFSTHLPTAVVEVEKLPVVIFPNPCTSFINVQLKNKNKSSVRVTLKDNIGRALIQNEIRKDDFSLSLEQFPQGIYFLTLITDASSYTYKILKQ